MFTYIQWIFTSEHGVTFYTALTPIFENLLSHIWVYKYVISVAFTSCSTVNFTFT